MGRNVFWGEMSHLGGKLGEMSFREKSPREKCPREKGLLGRNVRIPFFLHKTPFFVNSTLLSLA